MTGQNETDEEDTPGGRRLLVPISDTSTARQTVDHAVRAAAGGAVHLVYAISSEAGIPEGDREQAKGERLLERAAAWADESAGGADIEIETVTLGSEEYLFGPTDFADALGGYAAAHDLDGAIIDPEYWVDSVGPMLATFEASLERHGVAVEEARVARPARHERLPGTGDPFKIGTLFVISYAFYLILGNPLYAFDLITGAVAAAIVAITLGQVTFARQPTFPGSVLRTVRFAIYTPWVIWEIIKANVIIAIVILRPSMPIDPRMTRVNSKVGGGLPLLALANSITLTPGTLTVRANDQRLLVHTLIPASREDLFDGRLERAVRFVFYGREQARIPTPRERGDTEILGEEDT